MDQLIGHIRDVFSLLPHLETLVLGGNHIESLPDELFTYNKKLASFKIYNNRVPLRQLPGRLRGNLPILKYLGLSCGLDTIPEDIFINPQEVLEITIVANNLTELPLQLFADQVYLTYLSLSQNQLMSLPDGIFQSNTKLETLDLSWNQLQALPDGIFQNTLNLRSLKLSHNHLVTINDRILANLVDLQEPCLDNNDTVTIHSKAFVNKIGLMRIDVENNQLSDSSFLLELIKPSQLMYFAEEGSLNLKNNSIRTIPELSTIWKFRTIDLSYNAITMIEVGDLHHMYFDKRVNLSNNLIQTIYYTYPSTNCSGQNLVLDLSNNRVNCDCDLLPLLRLLESQSQGKCIDFPEHTVDKFQCGHPHSLEGRMVTKLSPQELVSRKLLMLGAN